MPKGVETITRVRKAKVDKLRPAESTPASEATYGNCAVLPRQPIETDRGMVGVEGWEIFCFDPAADVVRTDQVRYDGLLYNIEGEPRRFTKKGKFKALQITIVRVS